MQKRFSKFLLKASFLLALVSGGCATTAPLTDVYLNFPKAKGFEAAFRDGTTRLVLWTDSPQGLVCRPADQDAELFKYERSK